MQFSLTPPPLTFHNAHRKHIRCIPAFLAVAAFLLSINGLFCSFVQVISPTVVGSDGEPLSLHFGYYSHQSWNVTNTSNGTELQDICQAYPYDLSPPDTTFKVGRTFNLLALIFGASFLFLDILTGCASTNQKTSVRQASGVGYILVTICSGFSLLILQVCTLLNFGLLIRHYDHNVLTQCSTLYFIEYRVHKQCVVEPNPSLSRNYMRSRFRIQVNHCCYCIVVRISLWDYGNAPVDLEKSGIKSFQAIVTDY